MKLDLHVILNSSFEIFCSDELVKHEQYRCAFEWKTKSIVLLQWAPLNGIMVNGFNRILGSDLIGPICYTSIIHSYINVWKQPVNWIIRLMESDMVWPKVIPLSSAYCIFTLLLFVSFFKYRNQINRLNWVNNIALFQLLLRFAISNIKFLMILIFWSKQSLNEFRNYRS